MQTEEEWDEEGTNNLLSEEIVFDTDRSIRSFIEKMGKTETEKGVRIQDLIIELGDGGLRDETKNLLIEAASWIGEIGSVVIDMFACDCSDDALAEIIGSFTTKMAEGAF